MEERTYSIYGITLRTNFPLVAPLPTGVGPHDLTFTFVPEPPPEAATAVSRPLRHSVNLLPSGEPIISLYRAKEFDWIHVAEVVDYYLFPDRIVAHLLDPEYYPVVELNLLGAVLAYWCERGGTPMFHASAVVVDGHAVAFMASSGGGKSSLAAGLLESGFPLLTDDLLRVRFDSGRYWAYPGYPEMRFWPPDAERLIGRYEDLEFAHPADSKRRVPVGAGGIGAFCDEARPLSHLYFPCRGQAEDASKGVEIADVPPGQAVIDLIRGTFVPRWVKAAGLEQKQFQILADLVSRIPVRTIQFPPGFERFSSVLETILDDVRRKPAPDLPRD